MSTMAKEHAIAVAALLAAVLCAEGAAKDAWTFYLRPGAAEGDGTKSSPFGSFAAAQRAARKAANDTSDSSGPVEVIVLDGSYFLEKPVRFTKEDSGTAAHPVVWRAQTRGGVRFTGGIPVPKTKKLSPDDPAWPRIAEESRPHVLVADLKAAGISDYGDVKASGVGGPYMELVWGGRFQALAKWPNDDWTGVARTEEQKKDEKGKIIPSPSFSYLDDRVSRWTDEPAPYGNGFFRHNWHADRVAFERIDPETKTIFQKGRGSVYGYSAKGFWFGYNLLCELDAPGEYYIDRERGRLYFWPEGKGAGGELTATDDMFVFSAVSNLAFDGFRVENCRNKAVTVSGCADISFTSCSFSNAGDTAVSVLRSRDCRIAGCDIAWCGSGGVSVEGGDGKTLTHGNIVVENCHIHHFALENLTYAPAVRVQGCGNAVRHCTIHDAPHVALLFHGREHEFLRNEIHSVCLESGEMGAIYCGRDWTLCGNRIEANYIHDIYAPRNQPNRGVMLDDGCGGITVTSNIFVRVGEGISLAAVGNVVENNLFVSNFPPIAAWGNFADPEYFRNPYWAGGRDMLRLGGLPVHEEPWKTKYPYLGLLDDAIRTGTLRDPATRTVLRRNLSVGGSTNLVQFMDSRLPKSYGSRCAYTPKGWLVEDNSVDRSAPPPGFRRLPPLSQIGVYESPERITWPISHPVTVKCADLVYRKKP